MQHFRGNHKNKQQKQNQTHKKNQKPPEQHSLRNSYD